MKQTLTILLLSALSVLAMAQGTPNDEALKTLCRDVNNMMSTAADEQARQATFDQQTAAWQKKYDLNKISADQVEMVFSYGGMNLDAYLRRWLEPTLLAKAAKHTDMAFLRWKFMPENNSFMHSDKETSALMTFLMAKDLQTQLTAHPDYAQDVFSALTTMKDANWHTDGFSQAVLRLLDCNLSEAAVMDCIKAFNSIARVDSIASDQREAVRKACLKQYNTLLAALDVPRKQKACRQQIAFLQGPFACGTLVGGKAPDLHFIRMFRETADSVAVIDKKSLDDFKGKVIMIDFWGTKCVPCIQSFPEVAELQKHFEGKDVVILGITSLQGYFNDLPNHRTVQCRNNPEKELGCFPDYMKAMGINWHIAVTEEDVMNTDYGVLAIPHVTIIDRNGLVRHNAVNADNATKITLIESLLNE